MTAKMTMNAETRKDAGRIARIIDAPTQTNTYPELKVMCANLELREALEQVVSWIKVFERPTWTDEFLNREGDASLRWYEAATAALAASA